MKLFCSLVLIQLGACIEPPEEIEVIERPCTDCAHNSAELAANPFYWVSRDSVPMMGEGVKLVEFRKGRKTYPLDVDRTVLRYWGDDQRWHSGQELNGGVIRVVNRRDVQFDIRINQFGTGLPYWTDNNTESIETYIMSWKKTVAPDSDFQDFCPAETGQFAGGLNKEAVIFEGDHYDPKTLDITTTDMTDFAAPFNMSCVGTLPSKMALMRRTIATTDIRVWPPRPNDHQALVRAFAAQYCGGDAYTEPGHSIKIAGNVDDLEPWIWDPHTADHPEPEAVWNADGAVCIDTPRMMVHDSVVDSDNDIWTKIESECGLKHIPCASLDWFKSGNWKSHGQFKTATTKTPALTFGIH